MGANGNEAVNLNQLKMISNSLSNIPIATSDTVGGIKFVSDSEYEDIKQNMAMEFGTATAKCSMGSMPKALKCDATVTRTGDTVKLSGGVTFNRADSPDDGDVICIIPENFRPTTTIESTASFVVRLSSSSSSSSPDDIKIFSDGRVACYNYYNRSPLIAINFNNTRFNTTPFVYTPSDVPTEKLMTSNQVIDLMHTLLQKG